MADFFFTRPRTAFSPSSPPFPQPPTNPVDPRHSKLFLWLILHFTAGNMNSGKLSSVSFFFKKVDFSLFFSLKDKLCADIEFSAYFVISCRKHCDWKLSPPLGAFMTILLKIFADLCLFQVRKIRSCSLFLRLNWTLRRRISASFRRYARRKYCDWKLSPSQKARFWPRFFFPTSAFFMLDKYDSVAYLYEEKLARKRKIVFRWIRKKRIQKCQTPKKKWLPRITNVGFSPTALDPRKLARKKKHFRWIVISKNVKRPNMANLLFRPVFLRRIQKSLSVA